MTLPEEPPRDLLSRPDAGRSARSRLAAVGRGPDEPWVGLPLASVFVLAGALILVWLLWSPGSPDLAARVCAVGTASVSVSALGLFTSAPAGSTGSAG